MSDSGKEQPVCEICRSGFPETVLEEVVPEVLTEQTEPLAVCPACRVVYNFTPTDDDCVGCGAPIGAAEETGYRMAIEFPVDNRPGGPLADLAGELCADCASRIAVNTLFGGVNGRGEARKELMQALSAHEEAAIPRRQSDEEQTNPEEAS